MLPSIPQLLIVLVPLGIVIVVLYMIFSNRSDD